MKVKDLINHYCLDAEIKIDGIDGNVSVVCSDSEEVILAPDNDDPSNV